MEISIGVIVFCLVALAYFLYVHVDWPKTIDKLKRMLRAKLSRLKKQRLN